jgi:hypothetical protein
MALFINLAEQHFEHLTVMYRFTGNSMGQGALWKCLCDCGNTRIALGKSLRAGRITACQDCADVFKREKLRVAGMKHGLANTQEYKIWMGIIKRCHNQNNIAYNQYGGRGISIDPRWMTIEQFLADMGPRPSSLYSIERIDNDGPYSPDNCIWGTRVEQSRNTRRNHYITIDNVTKCLAEWCLETGIHYTTVLQRINRSGWDPIRALLTPVKPERKYHIPN